MGYVDEVEVVELGGGVENVFFVVGEMFCFCYFFCDVDECFGLFVEKWVECGENVEVEVE